MEKEKLEVDSVAKLSWQLMWGERRVATLIIIVISLLAGVFFPPITIFILVIYYAFLYEKSQQIFIQNFAKANSLSYQENGDESSLSGRLFKIGSARRMRHVVSGKYQDYPIKLFHYSYSTGSGKNRQTHSFTVFELGFAKTEFPHILLQSRKMWRFTPRDYFGEVRDEKLPLEDKYSKHFSLFGTKGYEIEIFEIFSPELLSYLSDKGAHYSIEFAGKNIYIYDDKTVPTRKGLEHIYTIAKYILDSSGPLIDRMHDDFSALHPYYRE